MQTVLAELVQPSDTALPFPIGEVVGDARRRKRDARRAQRAGTREARSQREAPYARDAYAVACEPPSPSLSFRRRGMESMSARDCAVCGAIVRHAVRHEITLVRRVRYVRCGWARGRVDAWACAGTRRRGCAPVKRDTAHTAQAEKTRVSYRTPYRTPYRTYRTYNGGLAVRPGVK